MELEGENQKLLYETKLAILTEEIKYYRDVMKSFIKIYEVQKECLDLFDNREEIYQAIRKDLDLDISMLKVALNSYEEH